MTEIISFIKSYDNLADLVVGVVIGSAGTWTFMQKMIVAEGKKRIAELKADYTSRIEALEHRLEHQEVESKERIQNLELLIQKLQDSRLNLALGKET